MQKRSPTGNRRLRRKATIEKSDRKIREIGEYTLHAQADQQIQAVFDNPRTEANLTRIWESLPADQKARLQAKGYGGSAGASKQTPYERSLAKQSLARKGIKIEE